MDDHAEHVAEHERWLQGHWHRLHLAWRPRWWRHPWRWLRWNQAAEDKKAVVLVDGHLKAHEEYVRPAPSSDPTLNAAWVRARLAECERWGARFAADVWREQLAWLEEHGYDV